jgi:hypothetical protein
MNCSIPPAEPPKLSQNAAVAQVELQKLAKTGLPGIHGGMSLHVTLAVIINYLLDNNLVRRCGYEHSDARITCFFTLCPFQGSCPLPKDQSETHQLLCGMIRSTLSRAGHPVDVIPAEVANQTTNNTYVLHVQKGK